MKPCCAFARLATTCLSVLALTSLSAQSVGTALVRHAPVINSGTVEGSVHLLLPENVSLNGGATISRELLVPGTPSIRLNGKPDYDGTVEGAGAASPSSYQITLNGNARLGHVVRRTNPVEIASVANVPAPSGNRVVTLSAPGQSAGDFATLRSLTLGSNVGQVVLPPGSYDQLTANTGSGFVLGIVGTTQPSIYYLQRLTLSGQARVEVVGPVILSLANALVVNGSVGASSDPGHLTLNVASGGVTLNGGAALYGYVHAPAGAIVLSGNSQLVGGLAADRLTVNGSAVVRVIQRSTTNRPPAVQMTAPISGASFPAPATIGLSASATDTDGTIARVEFFHGTSKLGEDGVAPFELTLTGVAGGSYSYFARATDNGGATADSGAVVVTVTTANQPPTIALTQPSDGALYTAGATIALAADAADADGSITRVEFFQGATKLGEDTTAPFEFTTPGLAAGTYVFTARAFDNLNASAISGAVTVTVLNPNQPPTVALTSPSDGATLTAPASLIVAATATDADGAITRVEFFRDAVKIGEDTAGPYELPVTGLASGTYHFVARAHDNQNSATDSAPRRVTVITPNVPPTVTLTSPAGGAIVPSSTPVAVTATATDPDGTIAGVEFYRGSERLGGGVTTGGTTYSYTHAPGFPPGTHTLLARATDSGGAFSESAGVNLRALARLPYTADFEATEGYVVGSLAQQLGWEVGAGSAAIVDGVAHTGSRSVLIHSGATLTQVAQTFAPLSGQSVVFVEFFAQPVADADLAAATRFEAEGAALTFVRSGLGGTLQVFAGNGSGGGTWQPSAFTMPVGDDGRSTAWIRLTLRLDFGTQRWDAFANGNLVAADVPFRISGATALTAFSIRGHAAAASRFDYFFAAATNPLFPDADQDGLDDRWEVLHGLNPMVNDRSGDLDGDGRTNVHEFVAGSSPQDYYNGTLPELTSLVSPDQRPAADGSIAVRVSQVNGSVLVNAPVSFEVTSGGLLLSSTTAGNDLATSVSLRTDAQGVARVFVRYPANPPPTSIVVAVARSGTMAKSLPIPLAAPISDSDGDGLHDPWEQTYLGTLEFGATHDPGGVGRTLLQSQQQALSPWPAPTVPAGLQVWYRSDLGVAATNGKVSRWTDISGNGVHAAQTTSGAQPTAVPATFGAKPSVRFDGAATTMRTAVVDLFKGQHDFTVVVVTSVASTQATYANIIDYDHGTPPYGGFALEQNEGATNQYALGWRTVANDGWVALGATMNVEPGSRQVLAYSKQGGSQQGFLNGLTKFNVSVPTEMGTNAPRVLLLGSFGAGGRHFRGDLAEVLIYNRALSSVERTQVEAAITARYSDSDGNGLPDTWEVAHFGHTGVDPSADADGDGLTNRREFELGTNPTALDTDRDGLPDGWEVAHGSNPTFSDGAADLDGDGLSNLAEFVLSTSPDRAAAPDTAGTINLRIYRPRD